MYILIYRERYSKVSKDVNIFQMNSIQGEI
jgi:hypothetical protein